MATYGLQTPTEIFFQAFLNFLLVHTHRTNEWISIKRHDCVSPLAETLYSGSPKLSRGARRREKKRKVLQPMLISFTFDLCVAYEATKSCGDP